MKKKKSKRALGKMSRNKGNRFEWALCTTANERKNITARRVPLSGGTSYATGDVELSTPHYPLLRCEAKRRAKLPVIFKELADYDFLAVREDRGEALVVIRYALFLDLLDRP